MALFCLELIQAAPLLLSVSSFGAATCKKKLYVIGGGPNGKLATDKTQCYDPAINNWSIKAPMPVEAKCVNAASFHDHIYVVGRYSINLPTRTVILYIFGTLFF